LCLLLNASVLLTPFNTTHAHVGHDQQSAEVHGGHRHDVAHGHEGGVEHSHDDWFEEEFSGTAPASGEAQVIELDAAVTNQSSLTSIAWVQWLPLACVIAVLAIGTQFCLAILRPPKSSPRSRSHRAYWRPPLRGPPPSIRSSLTACS
jgi:hypothetical protein